MTFVSAEGAFREAVLNEAKRDANNGQLLTHELELDEVNHLPVNPVFWGAGSIVAAILNCSPKVVTPIMCVGAHQGNRYGITIETVPKAVIISHEDLIGGNALFAKNVNSVANRGKDYILTVLQTQNQMINVVPIRPDHIEHFFELDGTPRGVRAIAKVFEGKKTTKDALVRNWLRAAFVAKDLDNNADSTSQLQIEPELPNGFSLEQSATVYTDLQIGFDEDDHTFGTTIANSIRNCLHPSFTPEPAEDREVIDVDNAPNRNVRQRTATPAQANTANDALLQRILQLEETLKEQLRKAERAQVTQQQRQPASTPTTRVSFTNDTLPFGDSGFTLTDNGFSTGSTSQFLPPANQGTTFETAGNTNPFGDTTIGTSAFGAPTGTGPTGFSFEATSGASGFSFGASAPARAPPRNVAQRLQELSDKAMTGHLTAEDMNAFNVLQATTAINTAPPLHAPAPKEKGNLGTRAFNLCGWAHLQPSELKHLHRCNEGGWMHYNKASNKVEREAVIDAYFVQPLVRKNGRFRQILTTEFRDLIITWRLAPTNYEGSKPHGGLGPLSFVTRSLAEQENLEFYRTLNTLTETPTSADIERTIPGTPKIPNNIDALITLLILNQIALVQVIGDKAPPATAIQRLIEALYDNYNRLTSITNFQGLISNEIVYQLCRHLERYFIVYCTEADVRERRFPKFNIDFLIQGIENNNLSLSHSYGPIFASKRTPPRAATPQAGTGGSGSGTRGGDGASTSASRKRAAAATAKAAQPAIRTGPGCTAIHKLIEDHRAKNDGKFPRLSDIRTANDFASTKDMCTEIGLKSSNCLMWGLYCSCKGKCRNTHQDDFSAFKPERALEILKKATTM
jgi:hypothetical protein